MPEIKEIAQGLRVYQHHGIKVIPGTRSGENHSADCPWCGREGKLSISESTGEAHCWACRINPDSPKGGINHTSFLRCLFNTSYKGTIKYDDLARDRWVSPETLIMWGACQSIIDGTWMLPGYDATSKLIQLYRWLPDLKHPGKRHLIPTPGIGHGIHTSQLFDKKARTLFVCEGPWDGMALWELLRTLKRVEKGYETTADPAKSLLKEYEVVAVPGCGSVGKPLQRLKPLFKGKHVSLLFDSDHPRGETKSVAGYEAMQRAAAVLSSQGDAPLDISYLHWGEEGYAPKRKDGWDVRDHLHQKLTPEGRIESFEDILEKLTQVPEEWIEGTKERQRAEGVLSCDKWSVLINGWKQAMRWSKPGEGLDYVLSVMLSVALSTDQSGDQLFLQVIGEAGTGKTRLCEAMLRSHHCYPLEHLTGFHSGWKDGNSGKDFSLISRVNKTTMITPEGDVLMSSPNFDEIMSQQRRIFDGTSGASYKNREEDMRYEGLRTPWIIAGTPALMNKDQSRLGDRFIRAILPEPESEERDQILLSVAYAALKAVVKKSNCDPSSILGEDYSLAYRLTGGYVDHLREHSEELLDAVVVDDRKVADECIRLANFTALMRGRPDPNYRKEEKHDTKEMPTRLTHQFIRLARCMAVVLNRKSIDDGVLKRVRQVALDTSRGRTLEICRVLVRVGSPGLSAGQLSKQTGQGEDGEEKFLRYLRKIKVVEKFTERGNGNIVRTKWRVTDTFQSLWLAVIGEESVE